MAVDGLHARVLPGLSINMGWFRKPLQCAWVAMYRVLSVVVLFVHFATSFLTVFVGS